MWKCIVLSCADSRLRLRLYHKGKLLMVCQHGSYEVLDSRDSEHATPTAAERRKARKLFWLKVSKMSAAVGTPRRSSYQRLRRERRQGKAQLPWHVAGLSGWTPIWGASLTHEIVQKAQQRIDSVIRWATPREED